MIDSEQIAHGLAMAYINNRYGAEVTGAFNVSTLGDDVTGSGTVQTDRLPRADAKRMVKVGTGEKHLFGLRERKALVDSGTYEVDATFERMINDYYGAFARFLELLENRTRANPIRDMNATDAE